MAPVGLTLLVICMAVYVSGSEVANCWQQKCRECNTESIKGPGTQVRCELRGLVSLSWLDSPVMDPAANLSPTNIEVDYSCIKMHATDPTVVGDSTDVIRGCVLTSTASSLCMALEGAEQARGKKDVRCTYCTGDYCNSAAGIQVSVIAIVASMLLAKLINH